MRKYMSVLRYIFGAILLVFGAVGTYSMFKEPYNPQSEGIMLFNKIFRDLHNAIMLSYMGYLVRFTQLLVGILLFTKRYWWIGLLIYLPFSVNIFSIHIFHDMPPVNASFFVSGMVVSILNFALVLYETKRLKALVIYPTTKPL